MPKFPVHAISAEPNASFIVRQLKDLWPFAFGFAVTGALITKVSIGLTEEQIHNSKMANPHAGLEH